MRPKADQDGKRLKKAEQYKEGINEIPPGKISAEFSGIDLTERYARFSEKIGIKSATADDVEEPGVGFPIFDSRRDGEVGDDMSS